MRLHPQQVAAVTLTTPSPSPPHDPCSFHTDGRVFFAPHPISLRIPPATYYPRSPGSHEYHLQGKRQRPSLLGQNPFGTKSPSERPYKWKSCWPSVDAHALGPTSGPSVTSRMKKCLRHVRCRCNGWLVSGSGGRGPRWYPAV